MDERTIATLDSPGERLGQPGRSLWRLAHADRVAFLVDADAYYRALADCLDEAQRSVLVVGWEFHSRMHLRHDGPELAPLLDRLVRRRRRLHVRVLAWDFSMIYAFERELVPTYGFGWKTHRRVHFELDGRHPLGASHHQKIVVVDDRVAFVGGIDLTMRRWDTPRHEPGDEERVDPYGHHYGPFHDVQAAVSGPAAAALGELARERWRRATGQVLRPRVAPRDPWPTALEPDLRQVEVGFSRTEPAYDGRAEVREIERLYLDALASARRYVYIESQFLSSTAIGGVLRASLERPRGPEIVLVVSRFGSGWLEENTVGFLRCKLVERLRAADAGGRLLVCYPDNRETDPSRTIKLHSKLCLIDDRLVTIGSANLTNRSMGLDTECNLVVETAGEARIERAVAALRDRLLGEHLGRPPQAVAEAIGREGSLIAAIGSLNDGPRRLLPLPPESPCGAALIVPDERLLDPERPLEAGELTRHFLDGAASTAGSARWLPTLLLASFLMLLAAAWRFGPLGEWVGPDRVAAWIESYRNDPLALAYTGVGYTVAGMLMFPLTLLLVQTAFVFEPFEALLHALVGSMSSAMAGYGVGRWLGRDRIRRLAGRMGGRVSRFLGRRGFATFALVRLVPVAPFAVVNVVAGASGVGAGAFAAGTLVGLLPGILGLTVLGRQAASWVRQPSWTGFVLLVLTLLVVLGAMRLAGERARRATERPPAAPA